MSESWRSIFTPYSEIEEKEPEIIPLTQIDGGLDESFFEPQGLCKGNDPMALVENISHRYYGKSPIQTYVGIGEGINTIRKVQILIGRLTGIGETSNLQVSKQLAAYNLLLDIINNNENEKLGLPADKDEALEYVNRIKPVHRTELNSRTKDSNPKDNWREQCATLKKGFRSQPTYECDDGVEEAHKKIFTCIAKFPEFEEDIIAKRSTKKIAMSNAVRDDIFYMIQELPDGPNAGKQKNEFGAYQPNETDENQILNSDRLVEEKQPLNSDKLDEKKPSNSDQLEENNLSNSDELEGNKNLNSEQLAGNDDKHSSNFDQLEEKKLFNSDQNPIETNEQNQVPNFFVPVFIFSFYAILVMYIFRV